MSQAMFYSGPQHANSSIHLSKEWSQIQIASSIEELKTASFGPGKSCIHYDEGMDGDFEELTRYLMEQKQSVKTFIDGEWETTHRLLEADEHARIELPVLERLSSSNELTEEGRKAALNFHNRIKHITSGVHCDFSRLLLQGPEYRSDEEHWHTDGYAGMRRVGCRVSGGETQTAHQGDVIETSSGLHGYSTVRDNARVKTLASCTVWANLQEVPVRERLTLMKWFNRHKYDTEMESNTHRRYWNGEAGLIFTTNMPL